MTNFIIGLVVLAVWGPFCHYFVFDWGHKKRSMKYDWYSEDEDSQHVFCGGDKVPDHKMP